MPPTEPPAADPTLTAPPAPAAGTPPPEAKAEGFNELLSNLLEDVPPEQLTDEQKQIKDGEKTRKAAGAVDDKEKARLAAEAEQKKKEAAAQPAAKPITARRDKVKRPELPIVRKEEPTAPPAAAAARAAAPADEELEEEERQYIKDAEEAEALLPRHKGLAEKAKNFVRKNIEYIKKHGGDENFDDSTPEYAAFLAANKPNLTQADVRELTETRIAAQVAERTRPEVEKLKDRAFADREEPRIERMGDDTYRKLALTAAPKAILDAIAEAAPQFGGDRGKAYAAIKDDFKVELGIVDEVLNEVKADMKEFERITTVNPETGRPLVQPSLTNPRDPKYAHHKKLEAIVRAVCNEYKQTAEGAKQRADGKWFVTKDEWFELDPAQRHLFYTFSNREIMDRALKSIPGYVQSRITKEMERLKALGFTRPPRVVKAAPPAAGRGAPAAPHPTPVPGAGGGDGAKSEGAKLAATLSAG
jgi:hypothetical protein